MHIAGEAPPELSPLDAFALQSRILARQLQESAKDGNRVSRLPPLTMESPLIVQGRSDYFRSMSQECLAESPSTPDQVDGVGQKTELEEAFEGSHRPVSMHPRMSRIQPSSEDAVPPMPDSIPDLPRSRPLMTPEPRGDFFGTRTRSPSPIRSDTQSQHDRRSEKSPIRRDGSTLTSSSSQAGFASHAMSPAKKQRSYDDAGLAPPRPSFLNQRPSSTSSSSYGSVDDDASSNQAASVQSAPARKMSSGSAAFAASGYTGAGSFHRSPSVSSDCSALPRPSFNFSRPLSRAGTPLFDQPSRQASSDSQPSFILADDSAHTPVSMHSEAFLDQQADDSRSAAPSYIYSKFSLPRGKAIQRDEPPEPMPTATFQWQQPNIPHSNVHKIPQAPPSPPTRPSSSSGRVMSDDAASVFARPSIDAPKASLDISRLGPDAYPSPNPSRPSFDVGRRSEDAPRGRTMQSLLNEASRGRTPASTATSDSASTIRGPPTIRSAAQSSSDMTAEEHLAKGIKCHENGSLNESTYHLRLAARQNNPTAMLLYALACRHGWGMRANQREGVEWLRKAAEYASVEIADDEDQLKEGKHVDFLESRTRKAQFALSVYELGVSHMNGWGIEQDKSLALRCFEIAGSKFHHECPVCSDFSMLTLYVTDWGDVDALAEAGFCYAQGVGCKKNLKTSAKFYRMAEAKGMSMVGNSWYVHLQLTLASFHCHTNNTSPGFTNQNTTKASLRRKRIRRRPAPAASHGRAPCLALKAKPSSFQLIAIFRDINTG